MLKSKSVDQILDVLTESRARHSNGEPLIRAYQRAVEAVSKDYHVAYQTIGDLCRRRLQLPTINSFYNLLEQWVMGNPDPLMNVLQTHTTIQNHGKLNAYFGERKQEIASITTKGETFTFRLSDDAAKKLKILSIECGSPSEWLSRAVPEVINARYKDWLNDQIRKDKED